MGEKRLAPWLRTPSPTPEILERQELVSVLREKLDLREDLAVTGEDLRATTDPESLIGWSEAAQVLPLGAIRIAAALLAFAALATLAFGIAKSFYLPFVIVLFLQAGVLGWLWRRAETLVEGLTSSAEGLILFSKILQRLEDEDYSSERL